VPGSRSGLRSFFRLAQRSAGASVSRHQILNGIDGRSTAGGDRPSRLSDVSMPGVVPQERARFEAVTQQFLHLPFVSRSDLTGDLGRSLEGPSR
jgi:hypothetical protein